jgi:hypothetical protein
MIDEHHPHGRIAAVRMGCCGKILNEADMVSYRHHRPSPDPRDRTLPALREGRSDRHRPRGAGRNYPLAIGVLGYAKTVLLQLLNCVPKARPEWRGSVSACFGHTEKI